MEKGELRSEVTQESMMETIRYMTEHFPYRLAVVPERQQQRSMLPTG